MGIIKFSPCPALHLYVDLRLFLAIVQLYPQLFNVGIKLILYIGVSDRLRILLVCNKVMVLIQLDGTSTPVYVYVCVCFFP